MGFEHYRTIRTSLLMMGAVAAMARWRPVSEVCFTNDHDHRHLPRCVFSRNIPLQKWHQIPDILRWYGLLMGPQKTFTRYRLTSLLRISVRHAQPPPPAVAGMTTTSSRTQLLFATAVISAGFWTPFRHRVYEHLPIIHLRTFCLLLVHLSIRISWSGSWVDLSRLTTMSAFVYGLIEYLHCRSNTWLLQLGYRFPRVSNAKAAHHTLVVPTIRSRDTPRCSCPKERNEYLSQLHRRA